MINPIRCRSVAVTIIAVLVMSLTMSSCEPLRKKFTRQKKKNASADMDFIPVLEPQDYPAPENNPIENYTQHYDLIKAWYRDLWTAIEDKGSSKQVRFTLKQINGHIDEMEKLVNEDQKPEFEKLRSLLAYYSEAIDKDVSMRNKSRIQSDLRAFDRKLRQLNAGKIKASLVPAIAAK